MPTKRLEMIFQNGAGGRVTISVLDPRADLTELEVQAAMNSVIAGNIFDSAGGDLVGIIGARIVTRDVTELVVA